MLVETTQSHELSAQTYHKCVMCSHFHSRAYEACHMSRARKFGGLPTLTPKGTLTLRKTLSPPYVPPNRNVTSSETHSPSHTLRPCGEWLVVSTDQLSDVTLKAECSHIPNERDGVYRPFCFAGRQLKVTNLARDDPIIKRAIFSFVLSHIL